MRKRSKYKPKPVLANALERALGRCSLVRDHEDAINLKIKNHQAMLDVARGNGTKAQLDILIAAMNMAEALATVNPALGSDYHAEIREAQDALLAMCRRGVAKGSFLFTGPELQAMNTGMSIHNAQLDACAIKDLEDADAFVQKALRSKKVRKIHEPTRAEV
jgi:hypothetical protein